MIKQRVMSQQETDNWRRYENALHAMQTGVKTEMGLQPVSDTAAHGPKHLRVGVNAAMANVGSLTRLLIDKGIITGEEISEYEADGMEHEAKMYEDRLSITLGKKITLQ